MGKKLTPYAMKCKREGRQPGVVNAAAWVNVVERCRPLGETEPIVQGIQTHYDPAGLLIEANDALADLIAHRVAPGNPVPYDRLAHVVDVTHLRALQVASESRGVNPMANDMHAARLAMHNVRERRERLGKYGLTGPEREALKTAMEHYEAVLLMSSGEQMHACEKVRISAIDRGVFFNTDAQGRR